MQTNRSSRQVAALLTLFFSTGALAQQVTIGTMPPAAEGTTSISTTVAPQSFLNYSYPATAGGTLTRATVDWSRTCAGAFKLVFLRRNVTSPTSFTVLAQRGPFDAVEGRNDVALVPPVSVNFLDLLAVVQLLPLQTCGTVRSERTTYADNTALNTTSDLGTGVVGPQANLVGGYIFAAMAYSNDPLLVRVLPVAGSNQGATAFFRTSLQILNQSVSPISGSLIFHRAGASAAPGDPSLQFNLVPKATVSYADVVNAMGATGLGSIDVVTTGGAAPVVSARVFSDGGSAGTSGFIVDALRLGDALEGNDPGVLLIPSDVTNFRMNVGVRTLSAGAVVRATYYDKTGNAIGSRVQTFPANYFEQQTAGQFVGATGALPADGRITFRLDSGSAFIYGTVTDNRTSDSSIRFARTR